MRMEIGDLLAVEHDVGRVAGVGQFEILVQREFLGRGRGAVFVPDGQKEALLVRIRSPQVDSKSTVSS